MLKPETTERYSGMMCCIVKHVMFCDIKILPALLYQLVPAPKIKCQKRGLNYDDDFLYFYGSVNATHDHPPQPLPGTCHFVFGNLEMHPTWGLPICTKAPPLGLEKYPNSSPRGQDQNNYTFVQ